MNPVSTPMDPNIKLEVKKAEEASMKEDPKIEHRYTQLIGSLMYLTLAMCPDISYMVNQLVQFTLNPKGQLLKRYSDISNRQGTPH